MENMELLRLQQSNIDLQKSVKTLEKECGSLAGKLIQGQVSRAQEAEEMFILKKELAKTRRKLSELEERQSQKESTESNESLHEESPKIVNGGGRGDDGGEDREEGEGFVLDCGPEIMVLEDEEAAARLQVVTPDHVTREEAQQVLRKLGVQSPVSPVESLPPVVEGDDSCRGNTNRSNHNGEKNTHFSEGSRINPVTTNSHPVGGGLAQPLSSSDANLVVAGVERRRRRLNSAHDSAAVAAELRRTRAQVEETMGELARVKLELAEASAHMEQKKMEARQALLREAQAVREADSARNYVAVLEQRLSESQMEKLSCPHCSKKLGESRTSDDGNPSSSSSSDVLFAHLRAMWNSQVATPPGSGSPSRTPRFGTYLDVTRAVSHSLHIQ
ncbi:hypothetical protein GBAR_LOCUS13341 [Geodia barretti]|nr:hypothetical protein GBAR_LOCUS13341 [Geodia barretti]